MGSVQSRVCRQLQVVGLAVAGVFGLPLSVSGAAPISDRGGVEVLHIQGPSPGLKLGLWHIAPRRTTGGASTVLILHGANVSQSGNAGYPFAGRSMMAALAEKGLDVWALDFYGYGASDRYPEMSEAPDRHPPLGPADEAANQVESAAKFIKHRTRASRIMLIGDSRGSLPAGIYAVREPAAVSRLVLFGPITSSSGGSAPATLPAYRLVTPSQLWGGFTEWSNSAGPPAALDQSMYETWAKTVLDSDPTSRTRNPPSIEIPNGSTADMVDVKSGRFPYDPAKITAPTLIVMGEKDEVATYPGAQWLLGALRAAPHRRLVVLGHASHTVQYEVERSQLYDVIAEFLTERDSGVSASAPAPARVH